ncbi:hypothetical protein BG003_007174 [Podila horticola]|nr:hypothetical protein BG003_007174 [Podila horticola]
MTKILNKLPGYHSGLPETQLPLIQQKINTDSMEQHGDMPIYNVLLIGQSQSGKSTLLEAIKQYANTEYKADLTRIGGGNIAHTSEPRIEEVVTCLPSYKIFETNHFGRQEIDLERFIEEKKFDDFKALLKRRKGLEVTAEGSASFSRFRIIDTPGLDDSQGRDVEILGRIFSTLSSLGHLHLVVITDSHTAILAPGYQAALQTYSTLFSTMHGLMTFVMTNIPNKQRHPDRQKSSGLYDKLEKRAEIISGIMGRRFPSFKIDCDLQEKRPFHIYLMRNVIRDILSTATIKTPVALKMQVRKTPRMKQADEIVYRNYADFFAGLQLNFEVLDSADRLRLEIIQKESEIAIKEDELQAIDTDELLHLYEVRFAQDWEHFYIIKPTILQYSTYDYSIGVSSSAYSSVEIMTNLASDEMKVDEDLVEEKGKEADEELVEGVEEKGKEADEELVEEIEKGKEADEELVEEIEEKGKEADGCAIDMVRVTHSAVNISEDLGGKGHKYWRVRFQRKSYKKGHYHAILSIKSCNKYRTRIDSLKLEINRLKEELEKLKQDRSRRVTELEFQGIPLTTAVDPKVYQSLHDRLSIFRKMMAATEGWNLKLGVFVELALSGVYSGGSSQADSDALERFWADKLGFDPSNHSTFRATYK